MPMIGGKWRNTDKPSKASVAQALDWLADMYGKYDIKIGDKMVSKRNGKAEAAVTTAQEIGKVIMGPAVKEAQELGTKFFSASRMQDGDLVQGVIEKIDLVEFDGKDENSDPTITTVGRYHLLWEGDKIVFMGTPAIDEKAGAAQKGDYICFQRVGMKRTRSGFNVADFKVWHAPKGKFTLPSVKVDAIAENAE